MEESTILQTPKEDKDTITLSSPLSSPTHEFSFTITLHPSPNSSPNITTNHNNNNNNNNNKSNKYSPRLALDLAPADDIFYHGHLLPLQLISRHSVDTICVQDLTFPTLNTATNEDVEIKDNTSFFGFNVEHDQNQKRKKTFDFGWFRKKYTRLMELILSSKGVKEKCDFRRRPHLFSENSNPKEKGYWTRWRRGFSAPASRWMSPSNSGFLSAMPAAVSSSDESSMEELQSAIQAAIAHCKNSTTVKEIDA